MKPIVNVLLLLFAVWSCGCQSQQSEAYLENLADENATLLEVIQKKNQELDQLSAQVQQLESALASKPAANLTAPLTTQTAALVSAPANGKKTGTARIVVAAGYPTSAPQQERESLAQPTITHQTDKPVPPGSVEASLNQLSDPAIELATRKKWKKAVLLAFANASVEVFAEKKGFVNRYTATALLDLLMYFPHQVKVSKVVKDSQDKIIQLRLQMNRQT